MCWYVPHTAKKAIFFFFLAVQCTEVGTHYDANNSYASGKNVLSCTECVVLLGDIDCATPPVPIHRCELGVGDL